MTQKFGPVQIGIILLTIATAAIHLALGIPNGLIMFILNVLGYLALVAALYLPQLRKYQAMTRWALVAFTTVTILGWVFVGERTPIAYIDKLIEVGLVALLFVEMRQK